MIILIHVYYEFIIIMFIIMIRTEGTIMCAYHSLSSSNYDELYKMHQLSIYHIIFDEVAISPPQIYINHVVCIPL